MKCRRLSGSDIKEYARACEARYGAASFSKKDNVEECTAAAKEQEYRVLRVNEFPSFFIFNSVLAPTLNLMYKDARFAVLPKITVDMGAIPYVTKGSDVMRPGIVKYDPFEKGAFVVIVDEKHGKMLAVGIALFGSKELEAIKTGRIIKTFHYVGDEFWKGAEKQ